MSKRNNQAGNVLRAKIADDLWQSRKNEIDRMYNIQKISQSEIANYYGISQAGIRKVFNRLNIKSNPKGNQRHKIINNLTGKKFNRLTVVGYVKSKNRPAWECICECKKITIVTTDKLLSETIKSCGCLRKDLGIKHFTIHGLSKNEKYRKLVRRVRSAKEYADKIQRTPKWSNLEEIKIIYENCPDGYEVDHIVPLKGKNVCGLHVEHNLQYLTKIENQRKYNKFG